MGGYERGITQTNWENDPWWTVSLGNKYFINRIVIFNRYGYFSYLRYGFRLEIMNTKKNNQAGVDVSTTFEFITYGDITIITSPGRKITIIIPGCSVGDKVKISIPGRKARLTMREVEVYGWMYESETEMKNQSTSTPTESVTTLPCPSNIFDKSNFSNGGCNSSNP